jgi:hypothetical protein
MYADAVPYRLGGGCVMQEEHPTHSDIHYRLGQVGEKCESLQASVKTLAHNDEVLTCTIAANHEAVTKKITGVNDKVIMLFTGVMIAAFLMPFVVPIVGHYMNAIWQDNSQPTTKP